MGEKIFRAAYMNLMSVLHCCNTGSVCTCRFCHLYSETVECERLVYNDRKECGSKWWWSVFVPSDIHLEKLNEL